VQTFGSGSKSNAADAPYSRTAMACPDAPVELMRALAAAAPTA
jgi:hypothetical protein